MAEDTKVIGFTEEQITNLVTSIFSSVNTRIADRIIQDINNDTTHSPSASAVKTYTDNQIKEKIAALMGGDNGDLKQIINDVIQEAISGKADKTAVDAKMDKSKPVSFSVNASSGWKKDSNTDYPNYYDIPITGITGNDIPATTFDMASLKPAAEFGFCPLCESINGFIRIRCQTIPTTTLTGSAWYYQGK